MMHQSHILHFIYTLLTIFRMRFKSRVKDSNPQLVTRTFSCSPKHSPCTDFGTTQTVSSTGLQKTCSLNDINELGTKQNPSDLCSLLFEDKSLYSDTDLAPLVSFDLI